MSDKGFSIHLGQDRDTGRDGPLMLSGRSLLRHVMALGSSGSGKTVLSKVLVEEVARHGIPAICIDPQGDLCSLALAAQDPESLVKRGVDPATAKAFTDSTEVVVFTPASRKGIALCADPLNSDPSQLTGHDRIQSISSIAGMLVALLGYDLTSDDGEGLAAVFDQALTELAETNRFPKGLKDFTAHFTNLDKAAEERFSSLMDTKKLTAARRKMSRLDVGARALLFHEGLPLNIDLLLGRGDYATDPSKTRISVIYLNSLNSGEEKEFFIAAIVEQLYSWMLQNPSNDPQALFYIDEVAPFLPPVRKPACKPGLQLLFKQARKYGLGCLMATQNPGDVDYKAMAQFGTWALGRLTTKQDMSKVQPTVKSLDPVNTDAVMSELPSLQAGQFLILSPDNYSETRRLQTRWLFTEHKTLDDDQISILCDERWRETFDSLEATLRTHAHSDEPVAPPVQAELTKPNEPAPVAHEASTGSSESYDSPYGDDDDYGDVHHDTPTDADSEQASPDPELVRMAGILAKKVAMTTAEFTDRANLTDSKGRTVLKALAGAGLARPFRDGRQHMHFATSTGGRPDLKLPSKITAIVPKISELQADALGRELQGSKTLGFIGQDESYQGCELAYRVLFQLKFTEKVETSWWKRIFGPKTEERKDSIYVHPATMQFVCWAPGKAVSLDDKPGDVASDIDDFDGHVSTEKIGPGTFEFNEEAWVKRIDDNKIKAEFKRRFKAKTGSLTPIFLPIWKLEMKVLGSGQSRILAIDGLSGKPLDW